jgi:hypothetical protein
MAHPSLLDVQDQLLADLNIQLTPIAPEASICLSYLERICNTLKILTPDEAAERGVERNTALLDFQDAQAKFKAWGISIAAFRSELHPTSLGFRLRDAPDIRKRLCQVLKELREYLNDCLWCPFLLYIIPAEVLQQVKLCLERDSTSHGEKILRVTAIPMKNTKTNGRRREKRSDQVGLNQPQSFRNCPRLSTLRFRT